MRGEIATAVGTILKTDPTVTSEQADLALAVLAADPTDARLVRVREVLDNIRSPEDIPPIYKRRVAAEILGVHVRTVDYYRRTGRLDPVYGSGDRVIGFSRESVLKKRQGRRVRRCAA